MVVDDVSGGGDELSPFGTGYNNAIADALLPVPFVAHRQEVVGSSGI